MNVLYFITECRFSKNQKQDISDGVFESDLSARDMLQDSTEVPTGSYEVLGCFIIQLLFKRTSSIYYD